MKVCVVFIVMMCTRVVLSATNLLNNGDFLSSNFNGNWKCSSCHLSISNDAQNGEYSGKVTQRSEVWAGVAQSVSVVPGQRYVFKGFVKLLNTVLGHQYHQIEILLTLYDQHGKRKHKQASVINYVQQAHGWTEVGFDYTVPSGVNEIRIRIQIPTPQVNYLVDNASLIQLAAASNWKSEANNRIEQLRKADINIIVQSPQGTNTDGLTIELQQIKSEFAFGTAVSATKIVDPAEKAYQNFFYENFEWAVLENALKWRLMERKRGFPNFDKPMTAIKVLQERGVPIRGHNMFWGVPGKSPKFLDEMSSSEILQEMHHHLNDMISHTHGTLQHWDVNNEKLHGDFFEQHTGNINITMDMFRWIHEKEANVKLFLNDFSVLKDGTYTTAYKNQAKRFKDAGVPLYGLGIQGHFPNSDLDMTTIKYRLDTIAEAGLPMWITELSIEDSDENSKADALEDIYTLLFSHSSIEGVLLWGFWDGKIFASSAALAHGDNVTPNAAGRRYQELFKTRWKTHQTLALSNKTLRGFKGQYTMNIKLNGQVIETKMFTLNDPKTITVNVQAAGGEPSTHTTIN